MKKRKHLDDGTRTAPASIHTYRHTVQIPTRALMLTVCESAVDLLVVLLQIMVTFSNEAISATPVTLFKGVAQRFQHTDMQHDMPDCRALHVLQDQEHLSSPVSRTLLPCEMSLPQTLLFPLSLRFLIERRY